AKAAAIVSAQVRTTTPTTARPRLMVSPSNSRKRIVGPILTPCRRRNRARARACPRNATTLCCGIVVAAGRPWYRPTDDAPPQRRLRPTLQHARDLDALASPKPGDWTAPARANVPRQPILD